MKKAIFLFCVMAAGCATTPAPHQTTGAMVKDSHQFYCDWSHPTLKFLMYADVENGVLVRERADINADGVIDHTVEYRPIDDALTEIWTEGRKIGEIRRTKNQIVADWEEPPRQVVMDLDNSGRMTQMTISDTTENPDPTTENNSVRTFVYEGDRLVKEVTKQGDVAEVTETHEYDEDGRRSSTTRITSGQFPETEKVTYTYDGGRCLGTVGP